MAETNKNLSISILIIVFGLIIASSVAAGPSVYQSIILGRYADYLGITGNSLIVGQPQGQAQQNWYCVVCPTSCPSGTTCSTTIPDGYCPYGICTTTNPKCITAPSYPYSGASESCSKICADKGLGCISSCSGSLPACANCGYSCTSAAWFCLCSELVPGYCIKPCDNPPTATNLQRINPDWCIMPFQFMLSWTFSDPNNDTQAAKQIQVSPSAIFSFIAHDSGKIENNSQAYTIPASGSGLEFNKTYYWRLKVWDSKGAESSWITASQTLITPKHAYPDPDFTWQPQKPGLDEEVQFTDLSQGSTIIVKWSWTFEDGSPSSSNTKNPTTTFGGGLTNKTVSLTVWDSDQYSCSTSKEIRLSVFAPIWREIVPW